MNFVSLEFWILVVITILGCNCCKKQNHKLAVLCIASVYFYAYWDVRFLLILVIYATMIYAITQKMKPGNKVLCALAIGISLILLGGFKYYNFFAESFRSITKIGLRTVNLILPLGISFYILTAIGYVIDVYRGKYAAEKNYLKVLVFIIFYPKILSGPIERGDKFFLKLDKMQLITQERLCVGIQIIVLGLMKKLVIADRLGVCVDAVFARPEIYNAPALICAVISYSVQIYCDFSGYTDIAYGVSYLVGIQLDNNFNLPYCAKNPTDFWKRWHISLSSWFRDYVYIPLGGNRRGKYRTYVNLIITMLISGLWHGANWTFVVWGLCHGIAQCLHRCWSRIKRQKSYVAMLLNFIFVTILWTIFRADSLKTAWIIFYGILNWQSGVNYMYVFTPIYFFSVIGIQQWCYKINNGNVHYPTLNLKKSSHLCIFTLEVLLLLALAYFGNSAFIYNNF